MKKEKWREVKVTDLVIYADEFDGVHKAVVKEVDIKVSLRERPAIYGYPYGKTAESGTVRIQYDHNDLICSLEQLIEYRVATLAQLARLWSQWKKVQNMALGWRSEYLDQVRAYAGG